MKKVRVNASAPYDVLVGPGLLGETGTLLKSVCQSNRMVIVTDDMVDGFYGKTFQKALESEGFFVFKYVVPSGETSKNFSNLESLLNFLAENGVKRNDTIAALGGGVIGDLAGFAAAVYLRGIAVVQIPTTLLAMVDSAIGGKTGIDLPMGKNLVGAFHQPKLVIADTDTLKTLPQEQFSAGMGEVIKYAVIGKNSILEHLEQEDLTEEITPCIQMKADIVEKDEWDQTGVREILNAGHTIGHAMEKLSGYTIPHGRAVAMGLVAEAKIAVKLDLADESVYHRILAEVKRRGLYEEIPYLPEKLAEEMQSDKKNKDGKITFILPKKIGEYVRQTLTVQQVTALLKE